MPVDKMTDEFILWRGATQGEEMEKRKIGVRAGLAGGTFAIVAALAVPAQAQTETGADAEWSEIVVTAAKRAERVRDISGSVSAFDEAALETVGARSLADYLTRTPGVVFNQTVPGNSAAIIRGVATTTGIAQAQGTTGYFINDVPMTDPFYSGGIPDIDTFDVDTVAILRGPQGTLFGSASLGGAINYQARRPNLAGIEAHIRGTYETVRRGEDGYSANAMLNLPVISDKLAIRGVFGHRRIGGFVDNLGTGEDDSNRTTINGGRVQVAFRPAEGTTINYLFLRQVQRTRDIGSTEPAIGPYEKRTLIPEPFRYATTIHNLRLDQDLGFASLTVTATRRAKIFSGQQDFSSFAGGALAGYAPIAFLEPGTIRGETVEARLTSPTGQRFEYLVGLFHDRTRQRIVNQLDAPAAAGDFGTPILLDAIVPVQGRESALFGEGSWRPSDTIKLTAGGRLFRTRLASTTITSGPLVGATAIAGGNSRETGFSPKLSLTWTPDPDLMIYALASRGFRFGGPNIATDPQFSIPPQFDSDALWNYEIGARATLMDGRLLLDGTVYWIDWSDIQVTQSSPGGFTYTANAGQARNRGFEASARLRPSRGLTIQGSVTYLDGELQRDFSSAAGLVRAGSRLPGASRWQLSDSITYEAAEIAYRPSISLSHRYVSRAPGELRPLPRMQGGYHLVDLRIGAQIGAFGVAAFVDNIADARGVSQSTSGLVRGPIQYLVRPRTIGLTLDHRL